MTAGWLRAGVGLMVLLVAPLSAHACKLPAGWTTMKAENDAAIRAAISNSGTSIDVGKPFAIDIAVCASGSVDEVKVDAVMPRHRHGMNYQPKVARTSSGMFRADPLLFHMPGLWRIKIKAYQKGKPTFLSLDMMVE